MRERAEGCQDGDSKGEGVTAASGHGVALGDIRIVTTGICNIEQLLCHGQNALIDIDFCGDAAENLGQRVKKSDARLVRQIRSPSAGA